MTTTEDPQTYLRRVGIAYTAASGRNGRELVMDCPACGAAGKASLNSRTWKWQCFRCSAAGGEVAFKRARGDIADLGTTTGDDIERQRAEQLARAILARHGSEDVERWADALQHAPEAATAREYLTSRGLNLSTCQRLLIGWSQQHPSAAEKTTSTGRRRRRRYADLPAQQVEAVEPVEAVDPGWLTIPAFTAWRDDGTPEPSSAAMVKLRSVPPSPKRYMRIKGGESILYMPAPLVADEPLILVGGEIDAISLWQAGWTNVAAGTVGETSWSDVWTEQLADVEDIVIVYDSDGAGRAGAEAVARKLGHHRVRVGSWPAPHKDANECLVALAADFEVSAIREIVAASRSTMTDRIEHVRDLRSTYLDRMRGGDQRGVTTGWACLDDALGGVRWGEVTVVTGDTSSGKTTFVSDWCRLMASPAKGTDSARGDRRGVPTLICPFEMGASRQLDKLVRQVSTYAPADLNDRQMHDALDALAELPIYILQRYGRMSAEALRNTLTYAARRLHIRFVVLDHLHYMVDEGADDERKQIADIMAVCTDIAMSEQIHIVVIAHPHGTGSGKDRDRDNRIVQLGDIKGSTAIKQVADNVLSVWKPRPAERDDVPDVDTHVSGSIVYCLKVRSDYGAEGRVPFDFWMRATRYRDTTTQQALLRKGTTNHQPHWTDDE